jgi:hypothetical protein
VLWKRTLTNLNNLRPTWLDLAHKVLEAAVFAAYGWPAALAYEQILERLLANKPGKGRRGSLSRRRLLLILRIASHA